MQVVISANQCEWIMHAALCQGASLARGAIAGQGSDGGHARQFVSVLHAQAEAMTRHYATPVLLIQFDRDRAFALHATSEIGSDINVRTTYSASPNYTLLSPRAGHSIAPSFALEQCSWSHGSACASDDLPQCCMRFTAGAAF